MKAPPHATQYFLGEKSGLLSGLQTRGVMESVALRLRDECYSPTFHFHAAHTRAQIRVDAFMLTNRGSHVWVADC